MCTCDCGHGSIRKNLEEDSKTFEVNENKKKKKANLKPKIYTDKDKLPDQKRFGSKFVHLADIVTAKDEGENTVLPGIPGLDPDDIIRTATMYKKQPEEGWKPSEKKQKPENVQPFECGVPDPDMYLEYEETVKREEERYLWKALPGHEEEATTSRRPASSQTEQELMWKVARLERELKCERVARRDVVEALAQLRGGRLAQERARVKEMAVWRKQTEDLVEKLEGLESKHYQKIAFLTEIVETAHAKEEAMLAEMSEMRREVATVKEAKGLAVNRVCQLRQEKVFIEERAKEDRSRFQDIIQKLSEDKGKQALEIKTLVAMFEAEMLKTGKIFAAERFKVLEKVSVLERKITFLDRRFQLGQSGNKLCDEGNIFDSKDVEEIKDFINIDKVANCGDCDGETKNVVYSATKTVEALEQAYLATFTHHQELAMQVAAGREEQLEQGQQVLSLVERLGKLEVDLEKISRQGVWVGDDKDPWGQSDVSGGGQVGRWQMLTNLLFFFFLFSWSVDTYPTLVWRQMRKTFSQ